MALSSVISRHPRYSTLLVVVLLAAAFLLFPSHPSMPLNRISDVEYFKSKSGGRSLKAALRDEEMRYQKVLADREAMVRKWGPTADRVLAFPDPNKPNGDFYTLWDFFIPAYQCPHHVERIGTMGDGGKWVCGIESLAHQPSCVVYSFGINGESSFEADVLSRAPGCQVYGYDFSVHSFGPEISQIRDLADRSHFWPYALGPADGHSHGEDPPMWSLESLMRINGHHFIDVLKIDIEGAEFESLGTFVDNLIAKAGGRPENVVLPIGQMQIEIHARGGSGHDTFAPFKKWWEKLESVGFRPFWTEPNMVYMNLVRGVRPDLVEYSFMNIRGDHALVSEHN